MNIRQPKTVRAEAGQLLGRAGQLREILLVYCGIVLAGSLVVSGLNQLMSLQMSRSGGLGNLGIRSMLSTLQTLLPLAYSLALLVLELGFYAAMLRISRGQFTSPQTLRTGLARFWPLLRLTMLQIPIYLAVAIVSMYLSMMLFFLTPFSNSVMELLLPMANAAADSQQMVNALLADEAVLERFFRAVIPMYAIMAVVMVGLLIPISYRLGMARFVIVDEPGCGAFRAMTQSFRMTRRNCMAFFKLDISFWWYHLLALAVGMLPVLDMFVPMSEGMGWLLYGVALAIQTGIYYFFRPNLEVSRCLIYEAIRPKPEPTGQVLGNIFQM